MCAEIVSRSLHDAVPALEALWRRFVGFGVRQPLREQLAVLGTLARLGGATAPSALRRIVLSEASPVSLVPAALRAAADARLALPAPFVSRFLDHEAGAVRAAALALAARANVPADELRDRLWDRYPGNRRLAAVALGLRGDAAGRQALREELARSPSAEVAEAIAGVWDDDVVVHLGRCARDHPGLAGAVLDALRDIGTVRAQRVASTLKSATGRALSARAQRGNPGLRGA